MKQIDIVPETIALETVLRNLGYGTSAPSGEVRELIDGALCQAHGIRGIKGAYTVKPITGRSATGLETDCGRIESARLADISKDASQLVFGLVTAGVLVDEKVEQSAGMMEACVWDALGTVISEQAVDRLLTDISSETGEALSMPFSPGYCDWELSGQAVIFNALDPAVLGISYFKDSFMMIPQKSVSFVACMGKGEMEKNPCKYCNMKKCFMRRK